MNRIANRAKVTVLLAVLLTGGLIFFLLQYFAESQNWVIFPGSPHVYNGSNIGTGAVTDRDGAVLLQMDDNGRTYAESTDLRKATVHWLGDRSGSISAPALSHYAAEIAGFSLFTGLYRYGDEMPVTKLTLSARAQMAALEAMDGHRGTAAVYNYKTGELLCSVTAPTFDPDNAPDIRNDPDGRYEGLYVNRFIGGTYTPGSIFKIVTLAAALEEDPEILNRKFVCTGSLKFGNDKITCEDPHWEQDLQHAFRNSCNCAFAQIAQELGQDTMMRYVKKFGIVDPVKFDGITTAPGNFDVRDTAPVSLGWAGIGQYTDLVNPAAFLRFMGAIASDGRPAEPYVVDKIYFSDKTTYEAKTHTGEQIMKPDTAKKLREFLRFNVQDKYGDQNFPGMTVCAKTGTGEVGGEQKPNAMLAGFVQDPEYPYAFIVCVEDGGYGSKTCIPIASKVLNVLKSED